MKKWLINFLIATLLFLLITAVKHYIRPNCESCSLSVRFILGILPNFLLGLSFPIVLNLFFRKFSVRWLYLVSFGLTVVMELELYYNGRAFDVFDLLASAFGLVLCYYIFHNSFLSIQKGVLHKSNS